MKTYCIITTGRCFIFSYLIFYQMCLLKRPAQKEQLSSFLVHVHTQGRARGLSQQPRLSWEVQRSVQACLLVN